MKRFAATLLSVAMILSLAACSSNQELESATPCIADHRRENCCI